jgi:membrane-associated phospholipid phosphatase
VYVGAHFPLDCVGSAVLGIGWAWVGWRSFQAWQVRRGDAATDDGAAAA